MAEKSREKISDGGPLHTLAGERLSSMVSRLERVETLAQGENTLAQTVRALKEKMFAELTQLDEEFHALDLSAKGSEANRKKNEIYKQITVLHESSNALEAAAQSLLQDEAEARKILASLQVGTREEKPSAKPKGKTKPEKNPEPTLEGESQGERSSAARREKPTARVLANRRSTRPMPPASPEAVDAEREESVVEIPSVGATLYLEPRSAQEKTVEARFIGVDPENPKKFLVRFSPNGGEKSIFRNNFLKERPETSPIDSAFPDSADYKNPLEALGLSAGQVIYVPIFKSSKIREVKVDHAEGNKIFFWDGRTRNGEKSIDWVFRDKLTTEKPDDSVLFGFTEREVPPFEKNQRVYLPRERDGKTIYEEVTFFHTFRDDETKAWVGFGEKDSGGRRWTVEWKTLLSELPSGETAISQDPKSPLNPDFGKHELEQKKQEIMHRLGLKKDAPVFLLPLSGKGEGIAKQILFLDLDNQHPEEDAWVQLSPQGNRARIELSALTTTKPEGTVVSAFEESPFYIDPESSNTIEGEAKSIGVDDLAVGDMVEYKPIKSPPGDEAFAMYVSDVTHDADGKIRTITLAFQSNDKPYPIMSSRSTIERIQIPDDTRRKMLERKKTSHLSPRADRGASSEESGVSFDLEPKVDEMFYVWFPEDSLLSDSDFVIDAVEANNKKKKEKSGRLAKIVNINKDNKTLKLYFEDGSFKVLSLAQWNSYKKEKTDNTFTGVDKSDRFVEGEERRYEGYKDNPEPGDIFIVEHFAKVFDKTKKKTNDDDTKGSGKTEEESWSLGAKLYHYGIKILPPPDQKGAVRFEYLTGKNKGNEGLMGESVVGKIIRYVSNPDELSPLLILPDGETSPLPILRDDLASVEAIPESTAAGESREMQFLGNPEIGKTYTFFETYPLKILSFEDDGIVIYNFRAENESYLSPDMWNKEVRDSGSIHPTEASEYMLERTGEALSYDTVQLFIGNHYTQPLYENEVFTLVSAVIGPEKSDRKLTLQLKSTGEIVEWTTAIGLVEAKEDAPLITPNPPAMPPHSPEGPSSGGPLSPEELDALLEGNEPPPPPGAPRPDAAPATPPAGEADNEENSENEEGAPEDEGNPAPEPNEDDEEDTPEGDENSESDSEEDEEAADEETGNDENEEGDAEDDENEDEEDDGGNGGDNDHEGDENPEPNPGGPDGPEGPEGPEGREGEDDGKSIREVLEEILDPQVLVTLQADFARACLEEKDRNIVQLEDRLSHIQEQIKDIFDNLDPETQARLQVLVTRDQKYTSYIDFVEKWKAEGYKVLYNVLDSMTAHDLQGAINADPALQKLIAEQAEKDAKDKTKYGTGILGKLKGIAVRALVPGAVGGMTGAVVRFVLGKVVPVATASAVAVGTLTQRLMDRSKFFKKEDQKDALQAQVYARLYDKFLQQQRDIGQGRLLSLVSQTIETGSTAGTEAKVHIDSLNVSIDELRDILEIKAQELQTLSDDEKIAATKEINRLTQLRVSLVAGKALFTQDQNNPARSYTPAVREATNRSAFFTNAWRSAVRGTEATSGAKWGLYSESTLKSLVGHIPPLLINAGAAFAVGMALPGMEFAGRAAVRGVTALVGKGGEAALLERSRIESLSREAIRHAQILLATGDREKMLEAERLFFAAYQVASAADRVKAGLKTGVLAGVGAATLGAALDALRALLPSIQSAVELPKASKPLEPLHIAVGSVSKEAVIPALDSSEKPYSEDITDPDWLKKENFKYQAELDKYATDQGDALAQEKQHSQNWLDRQNSSAQDMLNQYASEQDLVSHTYEVARGGGLLDAANHFQSDPVISERMIESLKSGRPEWLETANSRAKILGLSGDKLNGYIEKHLLHRWRVEEVEKFGVRIPKGNGDWLYTKTLQPGAQIELVFDNKGPHLQIVDKNLVTTHAPRTYGKTSSPKFNNDSAIDKMLAKQSASSELKVDDFKLDTSMPRVEKEIIVYRKPEVEGILMDDKGTNVVEKWNVPNHALKDGDIAWREVETTNNVGPKMRTEYMMWKNNDWVPTKMPENTISANSNVSTDKDLGLKSYPETKANAKTASYGNYEKVGNVPTSAKASTVPTETLSRQARPLADREVQSKQSFDELDRVSSAFDKATDMDLSRSQRLDALRSAVTEPTRYGVLDYSKGVGNNVSVSFGGRKVLVTEDNIDSIAKLTELSKDPRTATQNASEIRTLMDEIFEKKERTSVPPTEVLKDSDIDTLEAQYGKSIAFVEQVAREKYAQALPGVKITPTLRAEIDRVVEKFSAEYPKADADARARLQTELNDQIAKWQQGGRG